MKMKKVLLANGDSWAFGSEVMAPEFLAGPGEKGEGMGNRFKPGFHCWGKYNDYYRIPRIWPSYLGNYLNIPEVINISQPSRSNDTIIETTIHWLTENYISKNKSTEDLLVVIGWSSPERKNIMIGDSGVNNDSTIWFTMWPSMPETQYYQSPVIKDHFSFYVRHEWIEQEYLKRFIEQNYLLQLFCNAHNIDYYVFNSFYVSRNADFHNWKDISIPESIEKWDNLVDGWGDTHYNWDSIKKSLLSQWDQISKDRYINKDVPDGSFKGYMYSNVNENERLCGIHPSPESHEAWAKYLKDWIIEKTK